MRKFKFVIYYDESLVGAGIKDSEDFIKMAIEDADNVNGEGTITNISVTCVEVVNV